MRGTRALVLAFVLVVAACGGSADSTSTTETASTTTTGAATTVTSDDGIIEIEVPADAGAEVTVATVSEVPEEFEGLPLVGPVYELGPDGATFGTAVTITATFDADDVPGHPGTLLLPVLLSSDGTFDTLVDIHVEVSESQAIVTGTTEHFSLLTFVALGPEGDHGAGARVAMDPPSVERKVGESFVAKSVLAMFSEDHDRVLVDEWHFDPSVLAGGVTETSMGTTFTCIAPGTSEYAADVRLTAAPLSNVAIEQDGEKLTVLEQLLKAVTEGRAVVEVTAEITISGIATCVESGDTDALCDPDNDVGCNRFDIGGYTVTTKLPEQAGDSFNLQAHVTDPTGTPAAGMDFYGSTWQTGGTPGDPNAQHIGPIQTDADGNVVIGFMSYPDPWDVYFSFMNEVRLAGMFDANGFFFFP
ncbi:MAG: hypothetical protein WD184_08525 [Acidimicrobiia bacterium]